jgi:uncharacterized membrane protein YjfL (UPF0719 family)
MTLLNLIEILPHYLVALGHLLIVLFFLPVTKMLLDALSPFDDDKELTEKDNVAFSLTRAGEYSAVILIMAGALYGGSLLEVEKEAIFHTPHFLQQILWEYFQTFIWAVLGLILLILTKYYFVDRLLFPYFSIGKEIIHDRNPGAGAVEAAALIAVGIIIGCALSGENLSEPSSEIVLFKVPLHFQTTLKEEFWSEPLQKTLKEKQKKFSDKTKIRAEKDRWILEDPEQEQEHWFQKRTSPLFSLDSSVIPALLEGNLSVLTPFFKNKKYPLSSNAILEVLEAEQRWYIRDTREGNEVQYLLQKQGKGYTVSQEELVLTTTSLLSHPFFLDLTSAFLFWLSGCFMLWLCSKFYERTLGYSLHQEIERDNISAGVSFAFHLVAIALIVGKGIAGDFISWELSVEKFILHTFLGFFILLFCRFLIARLLFPLHKVSQEIVEDQNLSVSFIEGFISLSIALVLFISL